MDVTEWLGEEQYAYVPFEAPQDVANQLKELARELDSDVMRTQLVVSLDPMSRVREGEMATFWIDTSRMHLFDPSSGANLTNPEATVDQAGSVVQAQAAPPIQERNHDSGRRPAATVSVDGEARSPGDASTAT